VTLTETTTNGARYTDAEARHGAEVALRTDPLLTGDALGTMFPRLDGVARSGEWGRKMKRRYSADAAPMPVAGRSGTGSGTPVSGKAPAPARQRVTDSHVPTVPKTKRRAAVPRRDRWQVLVTVIVGLAGGAWSAGHTVHLATLAGAGRWAWVVPVTVDGLIFVCARHLRTVDRYWVAKVGLGLAILATFTINYLAEAPDLVDLRYVLRAMALAPVFAFIICAVLLERGAK
jgi:hypothetical protein